MPSRNATRFSIGGTRTGRDLLSYFTTVASPQPNAAPAARRPASDLIDAVLENMRTNLEPLKYSTLAPSRYVVYLHPDEFARIERNLSQTPDANYDLAINSLRCDFRIAGRYLSIISLFKSTGGLAPSGSLGT